MEMTTPPGSPARNREELLDSGFDGERLWGGHVDFVLVWDSKSVLSNSQEAKRKRQNFEHNLIEEGLVLTKDLDEQSGLTFVKLYAPDEVLIRYAEILKFRLPMKKVPGKVTESNLLSLPMLNEAVSKAKSWWTHWIHAWVSYDETLFPTGSVGLTAPFSKDKDYLFDMNRDDLFTQSMRSRVIEFILKRKRLSDKHDEGFVFGIDKALNDHIYESAYPLHDGDIDSKDSMRYALLKEWASLRKLLKIQPLDAVRDYFGVKVAMYFAWLGFYTNMLIFPAIVGLIVFIYGLISLESNVPSQEICGSEDFMCPACDYFCDYWQLNETCLHSKILYLFDNNATVFFAAFTSLWAAMFLEFWKRYSHEITYRWGTTNFTPEEEHPRPEYLEQLRNVQEKTVNFITQTTEPKVPFWSRKVPGVVLSMSTVLLMVSVVIATVVGVILYRMSMILALSTVDQETIQSNASLFISATGAAINLIGILIINQAYGYLAVWLTEIELNRTQTEFDDSLSLKIYLLQFVNYYASIFYVAFFKGQFVGHPGNYNKILGFRQEECSPGGCLMELCVQLAIVFVGKQLAMSVIEYYIPMIWRLMNTIKVAASTRKGSEKSPQWTKDYKLAEWGNQGLFYEYLEMVIQYGFVTIFVSAFPLAPFFAWINNFFELRLDAKKLLVHHRRPVAMRVKDIGIWLQVMEGLGRLAVFTNAVIIAFTSEFIPKLVYTYAYGPDNTLAGYTNFTLSYYDTDDFPKRSSSRVQDHPELCRYFDYRNGPTSPDAYELKDVYWHVLAARLAFVVIFQNVVALCVMAIKWIVPDVPKDLKEKIRKEAYLTNEVIIRTELLKAKGKYVPGQEYDFTQTDDAADGDLAFEDNIIITDKASKQSSPERDLNSLSHPQV